MNREQALQDLDYVRTLAEEGRAAPLLGGLHMVCWGTLAAAAFAGHWYALHVLMPQSGSGWPIWAVWGAFGVIAGIMATLLQKRLQGRPGVSAVSNRGEQAAWAGASLMLFAIASGAIGHMLVSGDTTAPNIIPPAAFAIYGGAMYATAHLSGTKVLVPFAYLAALVGLVLGVFADASWAYLGAAAGVLLVLTAPGFVLMSREPQDTV